MLSHDVRNAVSGSMSLLISLENPISTAFYEHCLINVTYLSQAFQNVLCTLQSLSQTLIFKMKYCLAIWDFRMEIKVRVIIFQYYMTLWVYISTVWCCLGVSGIVLGSKRGEA